MNDVQNNLFDRQIRQALNSLPGNVPAPGTLFNAAHLWDRLRPELATAPVVVPMARRRAGWWLVAATLAGLGWLMAGLLMWPKQLSTRQIAKKEVLTKQSTGAMTNSVVPKQRMPILPARKLLAQKAHTDHKALKNKPLSTEELTEPAIVRNESQAAPASVNNNVPVATATEPPVQGMAITATPTPRQVRNQALRRLAVVHENELQTQEEAISSQFTVHPPTERFVRLGAVVGSSVRSDQPAPAILVPLTRKSPQ